MKEGRRSPSRELDGRVELRAVGLNIDVRAANAGEDFKVCTAAAALFTVQQPNAPRPSLILLPLLFFPSLLSVRSLGILHVSTITLAPPQHPPSPRQPLFYHCGLD